MAGALGSLLLSKAIIGALALFKAVHFRADALLFLQEPSIAANGLFSFTLKHFFTLLVAFTFLIVWRKFAIFFVCIAFFYKKVNLTAISILLGYFLIL